MERRRNAQTTADPLNTIRACRECGCTEDRACIRADGWACHWVAWDLCSACTKEISNSVGGTPAGQPDRPERTKASSTTGEPSPAPPRSAKPCDADRCYAGKDAEVRRTPDKPGGKTAAGERQSDHANPLPVFELDFSELMYATLRWRDGGKIHSELMRVDSFVEAEQLASRLLATKQRGGRELTDIEVRRVF